ncbi:MAG TPA: universal stress protein [Gammaproteobacteria bacterium]|nr:universal stress protein [Gammaproteobacteria bacterium]
MEGYRHILCATDFSGYSEQAAERALELAQYYAARLTLLHVVEYFPIDRSNESITPEDVDPAVYREHRARASLNELVKRMDNEEAAQEVRFSPHSAKREIVQYAKQNNIDLIVVATHGQHGLTALLGSTAEGVAHTASCDVLVVRAQGNTG